MAIPFKLYLRSRRKKIWKGKITLCVGGRQEGKKILARKTAQLDGFIIVSLFPRPPPGVGKTTKKVLIITPTYARKGETAEMRAKSIFLSVEITPFVKKSFLRCEKVQLLARFLQTSSRSRALGRGLQRWS